MRSGIDRAVMQAPRGFWGFSYLEVTNFDGTWINLGALAVGSRTLNLFNTITWNDHIDNNTLSMQATFKREIGAFSLVPFRSDSPLNVDDAGVTYQPLLDLHRQWRLMGVFVPRNTYPDPEDYREFATGWVDRIDIPGEPATITVQCRGMEADLIDRRIMFVDATADPLVPITSETPKTYASGTQAEVIQAILDEELGVGVITLTVDGSAPSEFVNGWDQTTDVGLFDLLTEVAALGGGSLRYKYDASDVLTLTLYSVNRNPSSADWQTDPDEYEKLDAGIGNAGIRNFVAVRYVDTTFGPQIVTSPVVPPYPPVTASIARYGLRPLSIDLSAKTQVTDQTAAGNLADAVLSDWESPILEQRMVGTGLWFGELGDYVKILANAVHYNEDQYGGIVSYSHTFENGELVSTFEMSGTPKGRYRTWLDYGSGPPRVPFTPTVTANSATWKEFLVSSSYVPGVNAVATVNEYAQSVQFELSETLDFAVIISTNSADVVDGTAEYGWVGSGFVTPGKIYYVRATAFSGPLSGGTPTGVAGTFIVANTSNLVQPEDTATVEWDLDEQGKWKASVVGLEDLGEAVDEIIDGGASDIGIPLVFVHTHGGKERLTTIPAVAAEVGTSTVATGCRRKRRLTGAGEARLRAYAENVTGTPSLGAEASADDFATAGVSVTTLPIPGTGWHDTDWVPMPAGTNIDGVFRPTVLNGADTAAMDLRYFAMEVRAALVTALRDFSDDFSDDFS